jgi:adenylate cyclase
VNWLLQPSTRALDLELLLAGLANCLAQLGITVDRITTGVPILHPQVVSVSGLWQMDRPFVLRRFQANKNLLTQFQNSPIALVYKGQGPLRYRLDTPPPQAEFSILTELRAEGYIDYLILPVLFSDGTIKVVSFATRQL